MEVRKNTTIDMDSTDHHHHHPSSFWLPNHFLTDDDHHSTLHNNNDHHELLAELTRLHLARSRSPNPPPKPWMYSTSPQSTLHSGFGPRSGRSGLSSPTGPLRGKKSDVAWELLYEAAGQVAKLKMEAMAAAQLKLRQLQQKDRELQYEQQLKRQQGRDDWYCQQSGGRPGGGGGGGDGLGLPQSAWTPVAQNHRHSQRQQSGVSVHGGSEMRAVYLNGRGSGSGSGHTAVPVKRQSSGTGVFIPQSQRGVGTLPDPYSRKKPTKGCSTVLLPTRVVQALNLDLEEINNNGVNPNSHSRFGSRFLTHHDILIARRNALLSRQRRSMKAEGGATMAGGHDIRLPSDWTY